MPAIDTTRLLMELRSLAAEAQRAPSVGSVPGSVPGGGATPGVADFGSVLKSSINEVNGLQQSAAALATAFEQGQPGIDITRVMVEAQKANLAFRAMTEVRNRLVSAYQEVMNMPM
ncbi:MAG TPA: flagellar hook-basal body complex protein FliE [Steroidobacteraceae bacterium]|nr:flagellar hook-basal body complex protein FliE [Steroidobacteraceae bacterium]